MISSQARYDHFDTSPYMHLILFESFDIVVKLTSIIFLILAFYF